MLKNYFIIFFGFVLLQAEAKLAGKARLGGGYALNIVRQNALVDFNGEGYSEKLIHTSKVHFTDSSDMAFNKRNGHYEMQNLFVNTGFTESAIDIEYAFEKVVIGFSFVGIQLFDSHQSVTIKGDLEKIDAKARLFKISDIAVAQYAEEHSEEFSSEKKADQDWVNKYELWQKAYKEWHDKTDPYKPNFTGKKPVLDNGVKSAIIDMSIKNLNKGVLYRKLTEGKYIGKNDKEKIGADQGEIKVKHIVKVQYGPLLHFGPYLNFTLNQKMHLIAGLSVSIRSTRIEFLDEVFDDKISWGLMPHLRLEYRFNESFGSYIQVAYNKDTSIGRTDMLAHSEKFYGLAKTQAYLLAPLIAPMGEFENNDLFIISFGLVAHVF